MSWGSTFILPWGRLDLPAIESAVSRVLAGLPSRARESRLETRSPNSVRWFVQVYADEEQRWTVLAADEPLSVDIAFYHDPGDPAEGLKPRTTFSFDTADSGNYFVPGCTLHVCEGLAAYLGAECERD
jgi:hypothetical protein